MRFAWMAFTLMALLWDANSVRAQAVWGPSPMIGNWAHVAGVSTCPNGKHAIGIAVRYGTYVNFFQLECATLGPNGEHQSPNLVGGGIDGNGGTSTSTLRCPSGKAMVGFQGRADWWVDRIQIACKRWSTAGGGTQGSATWSASAGGAGGQPYGPVLCPGQYAVVKINGSYESHMIHGFLVYGYMFYCMAAA